MEASNDTIPLVVPSSGAVRALVKGLIPRALAIRRLRDERIPTVLLTFDDGPHPEVTPRVLDRLAEYDARAAFFVVGRRVRRANAVVNRTRKAGHVIGNHTHLHRPGYVSATAAQPTFMAYYRDCERCQGFIEAAAGVRPRWFRPPGGRLTPTTMLVAKLLGLRCVIWSLYVKDWTFQSADEARMGAAELLRRITPGDIVLLHDVNARVLDLLDVFLPELRRRGFDLKSGVDLL